MSAIEIIIEHAERVGELSVTKIDSARAELAQLRARTARVEALRDDSALLIGSNLLLSEIGKALGCAPDATILTQIEQMCAALQMVIDIRAPIDLDRARDMAYSLLAAHSPASQQEQGK